MKTIDTAGKLNQPDYSELVNLLPKLRFLVDATGTVRLEPDESERIRALGFDAQPGAWKVLPLPTYLVAGNPLLEPLGDNVDPFWRPRQSQQEPNPVIELADRGEVSVVAASPDPETPDPVSQPSEVSNPSPWNKDHAAILATIDRAGGKIERRVLQKKLWRMRAGLFHQAIESLQDQGLIQVQGKVLLAQPANQRGQLFHVVPPSQEGVPPVESPESLTRALDELTNFGRVPHTRQESR